MSNGIDASGFTRKRLNEILSDKNSAVKSVLGENLNLTPESPDGQINGVLSESDANLWELAEACYNAFSPSKATGNSLSDLVQINNIAREPAVATTVILTILGNENTIIPISSIISTFEGGISLTTNVEVVIPTSGIIEVLATVDQTGPIEISVNSVTVIDTPITGWDSVDNLVEGVIGQNAETDSELRSRRNRSISRSGLSMSESIAAEILAIETVIGVRVFENDSDLVDSNGLPPHSILPVVEGGEDSEIGSAILLKKSAGISTSGNTTVVVSDTQNINKTIFFSRPIEIPIYVRVDINVFSDFPADGENNIKNNIVEYVNGALITGKGFKAAEDVIRTELFTPVNITVGHSISLIAINVTGNPQPSDVNNIPIDFDEKSKFTLDNIQVNIL